MPAHYLLTISFGVGYHMHAYVITDDPDVLMDVVDRMMHELESRNMPVMLPIVLQTTLSKGVDTVRAIVSKDPQAAKYLATAKDFHLTIFGMHESNPDDARLMELH